QQSLVEDLNRLIRSGPIYDAQRFAGITLSAETGTLLAENPQGVEQVRLNRMLLPDAYPQELSRAREFPKAGAGLLFLAGLFLAKMLATLATVGSGAVGGVFTPTLFLGAGLGGFFGLALQQLGRGQDLPVATFAVV